MIGIIRNLPRFRRAYRELDMLAAREEWTHAEIEAWQLERLNALWRDVAQQVPFYRELQRTKSLPEQFRSLDEFRGEMPLLNKSQVRAGGKQFLSHRRTTGAWRRTGGSTGQPTSFFRSNSAHQAMLRARYRFYQAWDIDIFDRWLFFWRDPGSSRSGWPGRIERAIHRVKDRLRNRRLISAHELSTDDLRRHLDYINDFRTVAIYTHSTAGYLLAQEALRSGFQSDTLRLVNLTSEPAFDHMIDTIQRAFGVPAVIEYGSVECGFVAGEWPDRTLRVRDDLVIAETLPRNDGRYDIVLTLLDNTSFPLIRYQIGDISEASIVRPERGFSILPNLIGRNLDFVVAPDGKRVPAKLFEQLFRDQPDVRRWQIRQDRDGSILLVLEDPAGKVNELTGMFAQRVSELVEDCSITVEVVTRIPLTPAGKHRHIISELASQPVSTAEQISS